MPRHQVEGERTLRARKIGPVHADQADDPERDAAHRNHVAEADPAGQEALGTARVFEQPVQKCAHHVQGHRLIEARGLRPGDQLVEPVPHPLHPGLLLVVQGEQLPEQPTDRRAPAGQIPRCGETGAPGAEDLDEGLQDAEIGHLGAFHIHIG